VLFRDPVVPKGSLDVRVVDGVVELRGEADPETIRRLEEQARGIARVRDVRNLVHAPR
jgi:osmotically-inducible protein OsmY